MKTNLCLPAPATALFAAVLSTRKIGDTVTLDPSDIKDHQLCYCSRDASFRSSRVAQVESLQFVRDERLENISDNAQREHLSMVRGKRVVVRVVS